MLAWCLATLVAAGADDPMAALAGSYTVEVVDTWGEGIAKTTTRAEVVFQSGPDYDMLEFRLGEDSDERLPVRWRLFRRRDALRFAWVFDDRHVQQPVRQDDAVSVDGDLSLFTVVPRGNTEVRMTSWPTGFTYATRGKSCLVRYPHGCLVPLPWTSTREDVRATRVTPLTR